MSQDSLPNLDVTSPPATSPAARPLAVELLGPAGCGKTTLRRLLTELAPQVGAVPLPPSWDCVRYLAPLAGSLAKGRWTADRHVPSAGKRTWWTWAEIRSLLYLRAWHRTLGREMQTCTAAIFDHGPIFRLASLREHSAESTYGSECWRNWWNAALTAWSERLHLAVWLDAPNHILLERIRRRPQKHVCQHLPNQDAERFLDRYRDSFATILREMERRGTVSVLRLRSDEHSPRELAELVFQRLAALSPGSPLGTSSPSAEQPVAFATPT